MSDLYCVTRTERAEQVAGLRAEGLTYREVSERLGISKSYVRDLVSDPTGEKLAARRINNSGVCVDCGGPTSGNGGRANAPTRCTPCHRVYITPEHGTVGRYQSGCSCDACTAANREYHRRLKGQTPPNHGASGYINYGCRCDKCRDGYRVHLRRIDHSRFAMESRRRARLKPTPDHAHGTTTGYRYYGCRCDRCVAAQRAYERDYRRRKQEAA